MFHILVVDDDKNTRRLLKAVMEAENYTVFTAENGEDALDVMDREHIDLVVLDIMMPKMDGYAFTKTLRDGNNNLPILMISAKQLPQDKHKGFLAGTDDYMTKPIDEQEMLLRIIEEESLRLSYMATNILNLTRVENQSIFTEVTEFNLSEQIRACILLMENKWTSKHLEMHVDFGEYMISANEELLKQVWINLIDNAVKFSPDYGIIQIDIGEKDGLLTVAVSNNADPIPAESRKKIFNKFYQADESHSTEGNGIGLAVVKNVVELHKGTVAVDCGQQQVTFTVRLPKKACAQKG